VRTVILAGGAGTRLAEETQTKPKPMVEIGGRPILWHILKHYAHYGHDDFVVALGFRGHQIKQYFTEYHSLHGDLTVNLGSGEIHMHETSCEDWTVNLVETGLTTETGGRIRRLRHLLIDTFMLTFGDGVSDVDLDKLLAFHRAHGKLATLTAVRPPARFGHVELAGDTVTTFSEKPQAGEGWINGGYFVFEPEVIDYIDGDDIYLQKEPLEQLAKDGELMAYRHYDFWQCMDTVRDRDLLQKLWDGGDPPWRMWTPVKR
jgi:glucose-1-phosphate cytidylyltransferase